MRNKFEQLERYIQLHENVDIIYVVDGYQATFYEQDGNRRLYSEKGETILEAMTKLQERLVKSGTSRFSPGF